MTGRAAWLAACAAWIGLIFLALAWELVLAPLRPGGSWLVLKVLPLLLPLMGLLRARRYTFQWSVLLVWLYAVEGAVRAWSDEGLSAGLAAAEVTLAIAFFAAAVAWLRATRLEARARRHRGEEHLAQEQQQAPGEREHRHHE